MKGGSKASGFTIIETLIVLAVTGMIFISAALLINGKEAKTEFTQSIQNIQAQIQQTINEVQTGFYPSEENFTCNGSGNTVNFPAGGSSALGSNKGCIFLGKVMQFGVHGTNPEQYSTYTIAGLQTDPSGKEVDTLALAKPKVVPNSTVASTLRYGLTTQAMYYDNNPSNRIGAVGFISSLGQYSSGGDLMSGSQQVSLMPIATSALNATTTSTITTIQNRLAASPVNPTNGVEICFSSGTTQQSGLIAIGDSSRQLSVTLKIFSSRNCT
jgi:type II secretory pathway pseudopilin PulG